LEVTVKPAYLMCIVLALSSVSGLLGQEPSTALFSTLKAGQVVRVRARAGERIVSRVVAVRGDSLVLSSEGAVVAFDPTTIDSLWLRGRATVVGAIVGAATGALGSVAVSSAVCHSIREGFLCGESRTAVAWSTAGGAALGAGIGYVVRTWRLRYGRDPARAARPTVPDGIGLGVAVPLP
jgi:hypothetical protein